MFFPAIIDATITPHQGPVVITDETNKVIIELIKVAMTKFIKIDQIIFPNFLSFESLESSCKFNPKEIRANLLLYNFYANSLALSDNKYGSNLSDNFGPAYLNNLYNPYPPPANNAIGKTPGTNADVIIPPAITFSLLSFTNSVVLPSFSCIFLGFVIPIAVAFIIYDKTFCLFLSLGNNFCIFSKLSFVVSGILLTTVSLYKPNFSNATIIFSPNVVNNFPNIFNKSLTVLIPF